MKTTKITIGRLYNLGSYEHVRYEISVEVNPGESACDALTGLEKIMEALKPERACMVSTKFELDHENSRIIEMRKLLSKEGAEVFIRRHGFFEGTPQEYIERCELGYAENVSKRSQYETRARAARQLLDSLGGAAKWKDAKLDWDNGGGF